MGSDAYVKMKGVEVSMMQTGNYHPKIHIQIPKGMSGVRIIVSEDFNYGREKDTTLDKILEMK